MDSRKVCVVGSLNVDVVAYLDPHPSAAGYATGRRFETNAGGKSLNVALSLAAAETTVELVGRVGDDSFGALLLDRLERAGVSVEFVMVDDGAHTGVGHVRVSASGEYDTVVVPGANARLTTTDIDAYLEAAGTPDWVVLNLEVPLPTVRHAAAAFSSRGSRVVLNLSPLGEAAGDLPAADVTVLNLQEARLILGIAELGRADVADILSRLAARISGVIVVTLGEHGSAAFDGTRVIHQPAESVEVASAVGAGDSFLAVLVLVLASGASLDIALAAANRAGGLACRRSESNLAREDIGDIERHLGLSLGRRAETTRSTPGGTS